jgi:hypothetical protein
LRKGARPNNHPCLRSHTSPLAAAINISGSDLTVPRSFLDHGAVPLDMGAAYVIINNLSFPSLLSLAELLTHSLASFRSQSEEVVALNEVKRMGNLLLGSGMRFMKMGVDHG